ncbi:MAG: hypothetical protein AAF635_02000 [Cyanobacteria bacterium P01_C01_bin.69]
MELSGVSEAMALIDLWRCAGFLVGIVALWIVTGIAKTRGKLQESDSRKINHIAVFVGGALVFGWLPEAVARVNLYAIALLILSLVILVCCFQDSSPFSYAYAANTRSSDAPHSTFFFWFSWCVSIAALAAVDFLFTQMSVTRMAILIVGVADGIAEPIGKRYGRHRYPVLSFGDNPSFRSVEGSSAVWIATAVVVSAVALCSPNIVDSYISWSFAVVTISSVITIVEAISPRGCDNFTLLLTAAGLTNLLL